MENRIRAFHEQLQIQEHSENTRRQYVRDIRRFFQWLEGRPLTKEAVIAYKSLLEEGYRPASVNAKLAALNSFFRFAGREELRVRQLRIQPRAYCSSRQELTRQEYLRLVQTAQKHRNEKLSLLLQTLCATGIRVSELKAITVEAVQEGEAVIHLKGKTRVVLIPDKLLRTLRGYIRRCGITQGPIFISSRGEPLDRSNIWKMMKSLCRDAGVEESKVFPHNLRHLFARTFYSMDRDIAKLADILGHSSINTTRIYIITTGYEHRRRMDTLGLVI